MLIKEIFENTQEYLDKLEDKILTDDSSLTESDLLLYIVICNMNNYFNKFNEELTRIMKTQEANHKLLNELSFLFKNK